MIGRPGSRFRWAWARRSTAAAFLALLFLGRFDWFPWLKGTTTATTIGHIVPFADPLAAIEVMLATRSVQLELLLGATILLIFGALAGPVFCGWVCPLGLLLDLNDTLRRWVANRTRRTGWSLPEMSIPRAVRCGVLALVLGFSLVAQLPAFQILSPINTVSWVVVFFAWHGVLLVSVIAVVEHVAPRIWCRSLCPLGAVYSLMGGFARLRVYVRPHRGGKVRCGQCALYCPMGIRVMEEYVLSNKPSIDDPDCTRCGECVDRCPTKILRLGVRCADPDK